MNYQNQAAASTSSYDQYHYYNSNSTYKNYNNTHFYNQNTYAKPSPAITQPQQQQQNFSQPIPGYNSVGLDKTYAYNTAPLSPSPSPHSAVVQQVPQQAAYLSGYQQQPGATMQPPQSSAYQSFQPNNYYPYQQQQQQQPYPQYSMFDLIWKRDFFLNNYELFYF